LRPARVFHHSAESVHSGVVFMCKLRRKESPRSGDAPKP
jgi:hypothetical protein